ncbi:hypothetical protein Tco_0899512 [Tanacetum coccineum]
MITTPYSLENEKEEVCEHKNEDLHSMLEEKKEKSLNNNSFLGEYECSSLALDREEMRDEKKRLDYVKQDQTMLVIKRYAGLAASNARLREKVKRKVGSLSELHSKISTLEKENERVQQDWSALGQKNKKLRDHLAEAEAAAARDTAATMEHRFNDLRSEVAHFVSSDIDSLVRRFLSIDELNATLASILYLVITSGVERGLRMRRTDVEFKQASQNVFHFFIGAEAEFNKAVDALPST